MWRWLTMRSLLGILGSAILAILVLVLNLAFYAALTAVVIYIVLWLLQQFGVLMLLGVVVA
jgi:hypothetical protein